MADWLDNAIFYEIYPQSFNDTNDDGIGDINGIIEKLDYIKELGCNAIWINPCFDSPFGDAGYDVRNYKLIAARYGTNEDAKNLFSEAHKRDIKILLDLVPGHTSIEHPWFIESCKGVRNQYTDRYIWSNTVWEDVDSLHNLRGISERDGSVGVNFFSFQPALNYGYYNVTKDYQQHMDDEGPKASYEAMLDVMRFWLDMGCDGFRIDMAHSMIKGDPDSKGTILFWQKVRAFLDKEYPEARIISEWGEPSKSLAGGFHMDFLLHFGPSHYNDLFRCDNPYFAKEGKGSAKEFADTYNKYRSDSNGKGLICIPSSNHDMARISYRLDEENQKLAFAFLLSMPGCPFIYYGDEIGMRYQKELLSKEGGYERTGSRTPMQWDYNKKNAGFSNGDEASLYLPIDKEKGRTDVASQVNKEDSLYNEIKKLIAIRKEHKALLTKGSFSFVYVEENSYPLAYIRESNNERIMIIINPSNKEVSFETEELLKDVIYLYGKKPVQNGKIIKVFPVSAAYISL